MVFRSLVSRLLGRAAAPPLPKFQVSYAPVVDLEPGVDLAIVSRRSEVRGDRSRCYAYVSFTELPAAHAKEVRLPSEAIARRNPRWDSWIVDIRHPAWERILLTEVEEAVAGGYDRLFFDTVDGIDLLALDDTRAQTAIHARAAELLRRATDRVGGGVILNRGFGLHQTIDRRLDGVLIESYFFDRAEGGWKRRGRKERAWLRERAARARAEGRFVLALDYAPLGEQERAALEAEARAEGVSWRVADENLQ